MGIYNSSKHCHIAAILLTFNETAGDYYFAARAARNVAEWVACQNSLPNNIHLPFHLPLPIPAFNRDFPLVLDPDTNLYSQPTTAQIRYQVKSRFLHERSQRVRMRISSDAVYSPQLLVDPPHDTVVTFYKVDAVDMDCFMTLSDGDPGISAGLGAAFPSIGWTHIECWSHLSPDMKQKWSKSDQLNLKIPEQYVAHLSDRRQKRKKKISLMKKTKDIVRNVLNMARVTISSPLSDMLMSALVQSLTNGTGFMSDIQITLPEFAANIGSKYVRQTLNGSIGVWRFSDVCDFSNDQYTESGLMRDRVAKISCFYGGMPFSQSSLEAANRLTKDEFERRPRQVVDLMNKFIEYSEEFTRNEFEHYGISFSPLPYGSGSSNRYRSNVHSASISDGMLFVGCGTREDCEYDQRQVFIFDVSCIYFFIFPGIRTNIDTMKQLLAESS